jgi:hypothetical protein
MHYKRELMELLGYSPTGEATLPTDIERVECASTIRLPTNFPVLSPRDKYRASREKYEKQVKAV